LREGPDASAWGCLVTDFLSKLAKFLDQLLPFLESCPAWLRTWFYVLVVLNFLTIAAILVANLTYKQQHLKDESLQRFSVDQPRGNEEIPLGANLSWMLVGKLPVLEEKQEPPHVTVEVLKLPERTAVAQSGIWRPDTVQGFWRYESARFDGEGSYEIVATIARGSLSLPRIVQVRCVEKAAAYLDAVKQGRVAQGRAALDAAKPVAVAPSIPLPALKEQLMAMDYQFRKLYGMDRDLDGSLKVASSALALLDPVLPQHADDFQLQNYRAYFLKDYAMVMLDQNRPEEANAALHEANKMFSAIREQQPNDPSAWNGLGSVAALMGDYHSALYYIDQALAIEKDYTEAQHDREMVLNALRQQEQAGKAKTQ
jgi:tetratricopeptide (TPR) repeat protein